MLFLLPNMVQADMYTSGKPPTAVYNIFITPDGMLYTLDLKGMSRRATGCKGKK
jgi:hypothetical protein